jgi:Branched-chain amino acid ABC-type transport system, permease components
MDPTIFWTLVVDGVVNGTIYALLAIGLVLVFVVTRVILLPQGVYVSFAALTLSQFQRGNVPEPSDCCSHWGARRSLSTHCVCARASPGRGSYAAWQPIWCSRS